ncbi:MAG: hypothetical protein QF473_12990 [Planctomycetota bacterium]|nr:hypothetical protein [Planctomycetota bacterium]
MDKSPTRYVISVIFICPLYIPIQADVPSADALDRAIKSGDFVGYLADANAWLEKKTPAKPSRSSLEDLLRDPVFRTVLVQRQLIAKTGADKLSAFAKADPTNREFLRWLMRQARVTDLYLIANVPLSLADRANNTYTLDIKALEIWKQIIKSDPDAKDGIYLKLAIAAGMAPPGSVNIGAGGAEKPADPIDRYKYYKAAHQNKELFPSFDHLSVWE